MAIDGIKIIDSDLAHDIYNEFMDLYDSGLSINEIRERITSWEPELTDELEREIYFSVYCQALWEINELSDEDFKKLELIVTNETGLKLWKELSNQFYQERKLVLKKQLSKLIKKKKIPRNRKKYRKVTNFLFKKGDCLAYKHTNGNYYLLFVYSIGQHRSECLYSMAILNYCKVTLPKIDDVLNGQFLGRIIPTSLNSTGFEYGFAMVRPDHNDLIKYNSCFNKIGEINIRTDNNCIGSYGGVITQQDFEDDIVRIIEKRQVFGNKLINVSEILAKQ